MLLKGWVGGLSLRHLTLTSICWLQIHLTAFLPPQGRKRTAAGRHTAFVSERELRSEGTDDDVLQARIATVVELVPAQLGVEVDVVAIDALEGGDAVGLAVGAV